MRNLFRRIKNLWKLSEYRLGDKGLVKDFSTVKKLATIIPEEREELFPTK